MWYQYFQFAVVVLALLMAILLGVTKAIDEFTDSRTPTHILTFLLAVAGVLMFLDGLRGCTYTFATLLIAWLN